MISQCWFLNSVLLRCLSYRHLIWLKQLQWPFGVQVTVFGIDPLLLISSHPIIDEKRNTFLSCILLRKCSFSHLCLNCYHRTCMSTSVNIRLKIFYRLKFSILLWNINTRKFERICKNRGYMVLKIFTCLHNVNLVAIRAWISRAERDSIELLLIGKGGICRGNNQM